MLVFLFSACPKPQTRGSANRLLALQLVDSLRLPGQAVGLCSDRDELLLADNMGTNIYRVDLDLKLRPPIALPARVPGLRCLAADPFFVYLFDATRLFRFDRSRGTMNQASSNVQGHSAVALSSGQLAFSDGFSDRILILDPSGTMSDYNVQVSLQPGGITFGPDGNFYVLDQMRQSVMILNRVGSLVRSFALPGPSLRIAVDDSLSVYLLERAGGRIWQVDRHNSVATISAAELGVNLAATDMVVSSPWLYLLSHGQYLLKLHLPRSGD